MTIACCVIVPEGIVLGADSTSSMPTPNGHLHYFNHNQKLFEIGEDSTLAMLTWGLGGLRDTSYRSIAAELAQQLAVTPPTSVHDVAVQWSDRIWAAYNEAFSEILEIVRALEAKAPHVPGERSSAMRTRSEEDQFQQYLHNYYAGFCIAGYLPSDRTPRAFSIDISPIQRTPGQPIPVVRQEFWGAPNFITRIMQGYDPWIRRGILDSGKWGGTEAELDGILGAWRLEVPPMPIRDAIDYAYSSIHSTIKALKFSSLPQICGGPIEIAVITTDRSFRWVRHKPWDAAIDEGDC